MIDNHFNCCQDIGVKISNLAHDARGASTVNCLRKKKSFGATSSCTNIQYKSDFVQQKSLDDLCALFASSRQNEDRVVTIRFPRKGKSILGSQIIYPFIE